MKNGLTSGMRGHYSEFDDHGQIRFIEIHVYPYSETELDRLEQMDCLEDSQLGTFLRLIQKKIPSDTRYLYKLQTYLYLGNSIIASLNTRSLAF